MIEVLIELFSMLTAGGEEGTKVGRASRRRVFRDPFIMITSKQETKGPLEDSSIDGSGDGRHTA